MAKTKSQSGLLPVRPFVRGIKNLLNHPWDIVLPETDLTQERLVLKKGIGKVELLLKYEHKTLVTKLWKQGDTRFNEQYEIGLHVNNVLILLYTKERVKLIETMRKIYVRMLAKKVREDKAAKKEILAKLQEALVGSSISCEPKPPKVATATLQPVEN